MGWGEGGAGIISFLRQLLVQQSEAKILIELLNIKFCFTVWLT